MIPPGVEIETCESWVEWPEKVLEFSRTLIHYFGKILCKLDKEDVSNSEGTYNRYCM